VRIGPVPIYVHQVSTATTLVHVTTPEFEALINADAAGGAINAGIKGSTIYAGSSVYGGPFDGIATLTGNYGGYVTIPPSMMGNFSPVAGVGPISLWVRVAAGAYVMGPPSFYSQLVDMIAGQLGIATAQITGRSDNC
jgi:hypothetical protein